MIPKINKKLLLIITISIISLLGVTLSFFVWQSNENIDFSVTIGEFSTITYTKGNKISENDIGPVLDYNKGSSTIFNIKKNTESIINADVFVTPTVLPDNLKHESFKCLLLKSNDEQIWEIIDEINFSDKNINDKYLLGSVPNLNKGYTYFKVIIYIDGNIENPSNMMGNNFEAIINAEAYDAS